MHRFDEGQAADTRAEVDAYALGVLRSYPQPAVAPCLQSGGHAVMDENVHAACFLRRHVLAHLEALHLAGDLAREARRIEARDARDARRSAQGPVPGFGDVVADGADDAQAGDDDSSPAHAMESGNGAGLQPLECALM